MTENQEWNLNQVVTLPTNTTTTADNNWNVSQSSTSASIGTQQDTKQWDLQQPTPQQFGTPEHGEHQWNTTQHKPQSPMGKRSAAQTEEKKTEESVSSKSWTIEQPPSHSSTDIKTDPTKQSTLEPITDPIETNSVPFETTRTTPPRTEVNLPYAAQPSPKIQQVTVNEGVHKMTEDAVNQQANANKDVDKTDVSTRTTGSVEELPTEAVIEAEMPVVTKNKETKTTVVQPTPKQVAEQEVVITSQIEKQPTPSKDERPTVSQKTYFKSVTQVSVQSSKKSVSQPGPKETTQRHNVMQATESTSQAMLPATAPKPRQTSLPQTVLQQHPQQTSLKTVAQPNSQQKSVQPTVKSTPTTNSQDTYESKREDRDQIQLEEKQKGVFWLSPDLEGWIDKTKALKEEFRRQSDANEVYFVKNLQELNLKALNSSEDASKYLYNVADLKGIHVVNLIRCILNEYHHSEAGPFFFQFGEDKKFKLELLPTATQPGNGLIKTVGRRKYYSYPDICSMLKSAGVTSKGLGIMLQKLNTSGLKSALHNEISPMNELHFMLLFEVAKRLIRGPHGFSLSTEPEFDQLPIGVSVSRMITMFCRGNYCLNYEAVFGAQDKYNPFVDNSVVLRRQKIYALNKLFYEAEIRPQTKENPYIAKFLKYHNGYIIKTTQGYLDELDMAFKGF